MLYTYPYYLAWPLRTARMTLLSADKLGYKRSFLHIPHFCSMPRKKQKNNKQKKKLYLLQLFSTKEPLSSSCQDLHVWLCLIQELVPVKTIALKRAVQSSTHLYPWSTRHQLQQQKQQNICGITTEGRNKVLTCTATASSSHLTSSLNFAILREQRRKGGATGFQQNVENEQVTCSPSFNNFIYASLTYKHHLGMQDCKRHAVGSSSSIFSGRSTSSQLSDELQKTWARGWEPERRGAAVGLTL